MSDSTPWAGKPKRKRDKPFEPRADAAGKPQAATPVAGSWAGKPKRDGGDTPPGWAKKKKFKTPKPDGFRKKHKPGK